MSLRKVQERVGLLVVEYCGLSRIEYAVSEANEFARLYCFDSKRIDTQDELEILTCSSSESIQLVAGEAILLYVKLVQNS